jgi:hypothetical protein
MRLSGVFKLEKIPDTAFGGSGMTPNFLSSVSPAKAVTAAGGLLPGERRALECARH